MMGVKPTASFTQPQDTISSARVGSKEKNPFRKLRNTVPSDPWCKSEGFPQEAHCYLLQGERGVPIEVSSNWGPRQQLLLHTRCRDLGVGSTGKQWEEEGAAFIWQVFVAGLRSGLPQSNLTAALTKCSSESEEDGTMHQSPRAFIPPGPLSAMWEAVLSIRQH